MTAVVNLLGTYDFLPANPRRLKAFANRLAQLCARRVSVEARAKELAVKDWPLNADDAATAATIAYLQHYHPALWRRIELEPGFYEVLRGYVGGSIDNKRTPQDTERTANDRHPMMDEIDLPYYPKSLRPDAKPEERLQSRFIDRSYGHVLHAQRLIETTPISNPEFTAWTTGGAPKPTPLPASKV